jgi:hypothetical protein
VSARDLILSLLKDQPGEHLVIVRYSANHNPVLESVYNSAEVDGSRIVWARDMGTDKNAELIKYFATRQVWVAEPDKFPVVLTKYNAQTVEKDTSARHQIQEASTSSP